MSYDNRKEAKQRMKKMSDWQLYLFVLKMNDKYPNKYRLKCPWSTWDWINQNPARFIMYLAFCIGLKPWLWFGVTK